MLPGLRTAGRAAELLVASRSDYVVTFSYQPIASTMVSYSIDSVPRLGGINGFVPTKALSKAPYGFQGSLPHSALEDCAIDG